MLCVDSVVFRYEQNQDPIINGISLKVRPGQLVTVMGANGSGKSTLARLLNGLLIPESGTIKVDDLTTCQEEHLWAVRANVGMVFQNPEHQIVAPTVEDDIAFGLENQGMEPREMAVRVKEVLSRLDLGKYRDSSPNKLSGGEKQRLAIAGILAMRPKYLVLDEASAMLDPKSRIELLKLIKELKNQGMGIVMVTQHPEEALISDTLVVLHRGKIVLCGVPAEVLSTGPDVLRCYGLNTTSIGRLNYRLGQHGFKIPGTVLTVEEMVKALC